MNSIRSSGYWIFNRTQSHVLGKVSPPQWRYLLNTVRVVRKIKELQRIMPFSDSARGGGYKVKISHFYTFVLFRETYNIIGRYYKTCVFCHRLRVICTHVLCVCSDLYRYSCDFREMPYTRVNRKKINFHVTFDAIAIYFENINFVYRYLLTY